MFKHFQVRATMWALLPRSFKRLSLLLLRWEANENLRESGEWLDAAPGRIAKLRAYSDALSTDLRLLDAGIRSDYRARDRV